MKAEPPLLRASREAHNGKTLKNGSFINFSVRRGKTIDSLFVQDVYSYHLTLVLIWRKEAMKKRGKIIGKYVLSLLIVITMFFSSSVSAGVVPSWVWSSVFKIMKYGSTSFLDYAANNWFLRECDEVVEYNSHSWKVYLRSAKFNDQSSNTGSFVGYKTKIATTWNQSRTKTYVTLHGDRRSFFSGSRYIAIQVLKPNGTLDYLERIENHGSRFYEVVGNTRDLGDYHFIFVYTDSNTWDLDVFINDLYYPIVPVYPQSIGGVNSQRNQNNHPSETRRYRLPSFIGEESRVPHQLKNDGTLTFQELINEKTDPVSNEEIDVIMHYDKGDVVVFNDIIKSIRYDSERNITEFKYESTADEMRALEFYGDLTNDYSVGEYMQLRFQVVEIGNVNGIALESFDYLEDYNFDGDAAPHIEPYL